MTDGTSRPPDRRDRSKRLVEQFSDRGDRADIWRALDLVLPTDEFLNVGYSRAWQTHLVGSPQLRLVRRVLAELASLDRQWAEGRLLDLGCGRGGATRYVAERYGADAVGVDLVPYNVERARAGARPRGSSPSPDRSSPADRSPSPDRSSPADRSPSTGRAHRRRSPSFVVGDATRLPFDRDAFTTCVSLDSIVYMAEKRRVFAELARVLEPRGVCVVSDLVVAPGVGDERALERFRTAWDMPPLWTRHAYREAIEAAGLAAPVVTDISAYSVRRFRPWTRLFLTVADGPLGRLLERALVHRGLDPERVVSQVRAAHNALPALRHVLVPIYGTGE